MMKPSEKQIQFMAVAGIGVALYMLFGHMLPAIV